jgi:hypothetical protein
MEEYLGYKAMVWLTCLLRICNMWKLSDTNDEVKDGISIRSEHVLCD